MAERRMFAKSIIDSDEFLAMPLSSQALYFHLCMRADDEGFINNSKKMQQWIGASEDDLKLLIAKRFVIPFQSGVIVIKHWKIHNYIRADRFKPTNYEEEKELLVVKGNGAYTLDKDQWQPNVNQVSTKCQPSDSIGKDRIGKDRIGKDRIGKDRIGKETIDAQINSYTSNKELQEALNGFIEMRRAIKKPLLTKRALTLNLNALDKLADSDCLKVAIVNESVKHNWQTFYQLKTDTPKQLPQKQTVLDQNKKNFDEVRKKLEEGGYNV